MEKSLLHRILSVFAAVALFGAVGCSSGTVENTDEVPPGELPVVESTTDELPGTMQPEGDGEAVAAAPEQTADQLAPEASTEVPSEPQTMTADAAPPAGDAPAPVADNSGMSEAPPSMNETAPAPSNVVEAPPAGAGNATYAVERGDTLMLIAFKVYGDVFQWRKILADNTDRISDPSHLAAGTQLRVDNEAADDYYNGFERYLIKHGDTLGLISNDIYGTKRKWKKLWRMNDRMIKDPNRIYAGFFLRYNMTEKEKQHVAPLAGGDQLNRNPSSDQATAPAQEQQGAGAPPPAQ